MCCPASRFFARPLAELITSQGRDILQSTVDLVNDMGVPGLEVRPVRVCFQVQCLFGLILCSKRLAARCAAGDGWHFG